MANDCNFDIYFRGKRGNVMLLCDSVATYHGTELLYAAGTDDLYEAHIQGVCAWSVNYCVTDEWYGAEVGAGFEQAFRNRAAQIGPAVHRVFPVRKIPRASMRRHGALLVLRVRI